MRVGYSFAPNRPLADLPKFVAPQRPANSLIWHMRVAHVATGHVMRVGEYRGAATVWSLSGTESLATETETEVSGTEPLATETKVGGTEFRGTETE